MMKKLIASSVVLAFGTAFLVGCGDEVNTTEITQVVGMQVLDKGESLPKCTADNEGAMVYSMDSAEAFYCIDKKWKSMKGEKGDKGENGEKGEKGADGKNGADGASGPAGADGKDGKDGISCTAKSLKNGKGYKIVCDGDSVGVVLNGEDGPEGAKGDSGIAGLSAYEIAKAAGFRGTEEEWIQSLKGAQGAKGDSGVAGLSAYEIAKAGGYKGSKEEWIASLKGVKGDSGAAGTSCSAEDITGGVKITCTDGKTFTLSNGADGKSFDDSWLLDRRNNRIYKVVTIGTQTWMKENLNYETPEGSYCYNDSAEYCEKYGRLYRWAAAVGKSEDECGYGKYCNLGNEKVRGVCPEGWHLPNTSEWDTLFKAVGGWKTAGSMLKSTEGWQDDDDGTSGNGSDTFGFSALPAGHKSGYRFFNVGYSASFWSSTERDVHMAYNAVVEYDFDAVSTDDCYKDIGVSVRCLKD